MRCCRHTVTAENRLEAFLRARARVDTVAAWYAYGADGDGR